FTTRPDTLFGATYAVLSPEHPLIDDIVSNEQKEAVQNYIKEVQSKSDLERTDLAKEKTGVFTGAYAINLANNEKMPIWVEDYVLMTYGTGAIMAVPAYDERDYEFTTKIKLPIAEFISGEDVSKEELTDNNEHINSELINGLKTNTAIAKTIE